MTNTILDRINEKTIKRDNGCISWNGGKNPAGYGYIRVEKKIRLVHRLVYQEHTGEDINDLFISHTCDDRSFCNINHLKLLTIEESNRERQFKKDHLFIIRSKVKINEETGCHEYQGVRDDAGYGITSYRAKNKRVHRLILELINKKEIDKNLVVMHLCDNPCCCNPEHLKIGTPKENNQDKIDKGRAVITRGEKSGNAILTEKQVLEIRELYPKLTQRKIAEMYNIKFQHVSKLIKREIWNHI